MLFFSVSNNAGLGTGSVVFSAVSPSQPNVVNTAPATQSVLLAPTTTFFVTSAPTVLNVNGTQFYPAGTPNTPPANQYQYNPQSQTVTLPSPTVGSVVALGQVLPQLVIQFPDIVVESFSLNRGLGEQPTCSFQLAVPIARYDTTIAEYQPGRRLNIAGIGFAVSTITVTQASVSETLRVSLITVNCVGQWFQHLTPQPYNLVTDRNPSVTSLQAIAAYGGASLLFPIAPVVVPRRTAISESYDWASTLDGHALYNRGVVYWSNPNAIDIKPIRYADPPQWYFGEEEVIGAVNISYPEPYLWQATRNNVAQPADTPLSSVVAGVPSLPDPGNIQPANLGQPAFRFTNNPLTGDYFASEAQYLDYTFLTALGSSTSFIPRSRVRLSSSSGSRAMPDWASGTVKSLSASSDITGYTQTYSYSTTIDGQPEYELNEIWGFKIPASGLKQSASSYWSIIERDEKTYVYGVYDYLTGYQKSGFKSLRFTVPDPTAAPPANNAANTTKYSYSDVPVTGWGYYQLEPHDKYYPSEGPKGVIINADNTVTADPTYVPEYFVKSERREEFGIEIAQNPAGANKPELTKGKEYVYNRTVKITDNGLGGASLTGFVTTTQLNEIKEAQRYREDFTEYSAEGAGFDGVSQNSGYQEYQGQPPVAPGLPSLYKAQDLVQQQLEVYDLVSKNYQAILVRDADYNGATGGSISYPEARTIGQAQISAQTDWLIKNIRQGVQVSFTLPGTVAIAEGDKCWVAFNGRSYLGWVVNVSIGGQVVPNSIGSTFNTDVTIGCPPILDPATQVQFTFIPKDQITVLGSGNQGSTGFSITSHTKSRLK